jgi:hypothetical protein
MELENVKLVVADGRIGGSRRSFMQDCRRHSHKNVADLISVKVIIANGRMGLVVDHSCKAFLHIRIVSSSTSMNSDTVSLPSICNLSVPQTWHNSAYLSYSFPYPTPSHFHTTRWSSTPNFELCLGVPCLEGQQGDPEVLHHVSTGSFLSLIPLLHALIPLGGDHFFALSIALGSPALENSRVTPRLFIRLLTASAIVGVISLMGGGRVNEPSPSATH